MSESLESVLVLLDSVRQQIPVLSEIKYLPGSLCLLVISQMASAEEGEIQHKFKSKGKART